MSTMNGPYDRILGGGGGSVVVGSTGLITLTSPALGTVTTEQSSLTQAAQTLTITGGYTNQRFALFNQPTISAGSALTAANAATVAIVNAPVPAASALITRPMSLWVQNGQVGIDSASGLSTATTAQVGPAVAVTGAWVTGGSATTNKPHVLIEPAGTSSTLWSTSGTGLAVNAASGFAGDLMIAQVAGVFRFRVDSNGRILGQSFNLSGSATPIVVTQAAGNSATNVGIIYTGGALTTLTVAENIDINWNLARTVTFTTGGGTIATQRAFLVQAPTYAAATNAITITNGATVAISGAPVNGANATVTNPWSLWIQAGNVAIDAKVGRYNSVATTGMGVPAVYASTTTGTITNAATTIVNAFAVPAAISTYEISVTVNVTASATAAMTVTVSYTDAAGTARVETLSFNLLAGTQVQSILTANGNIDYTNSVTTFRCAASSTITIATAGTVSGITYTAQAIIKQVA